MQHFLLRYTLALKSYQTILLPSNVPIIDARLEYSVIALTVLVPMGRAEKSRYFEIMATGERCDTDPASKALPSIERKFVSAIEDKRGGETWMLFELTRLPAEENRKHARRIDARVPLPWQDEDQACDLVADMARSPFTDEQIETLKIHQKTSSAPYRHCRAMRVEQRGLVCPECGSIQTWAEPKFVPPASGGPPGPTTASSSVPTAS